MIAGHGVGAIVAWTYQGVVQVAVVEGVTRDPDRNPVTYWCRLVGCRLERRVGKSPVEVTLVASYDDLIATATTVVEVAGT